jgi:hypothetical protein
LGCVEKPVRIVEDIEPAGKPLLHDFSIRAAFSAEKQLAGTRCGPVFGLFTPSR